MFVSFPWKKKNELYDGVSQMWTVFFILVIRNWWKTLMFRLPVCLFFFYNPSACKKKKSIKFGSSVPNILQNSQCYLKMHPVTLYLSVIQNSTSQKQLDYYLWYKRNALQNTWGAVLGDWMNRVLTTEADVSQIFLCCVTGFDTSGIIKAGNHISVVNEVNCAQFDAR